ncbi:hypothetical protein F4861DRAFT_538497 [Xylaria intraflava]|nr:hypothetical protein F4861DRAFT_538497 [Xylaria intraflava]
MHRWNSVSQRRLDRRKSATSVKSVHLNHIAPATAEHHAQVAATQAFMRARERSATDSNSLLWPPPRDIGPGSNASTYNPPSTMTRSEEAILLRQQSIRFVPRESSYLAMDRTMTGDTSPSRASHVSKKPVADVGEADIRPSSSASTSGMIYAAKGTAGDYIDTILPSDEYYTPEDGIASMPSSYRKIRKSKSMFTNITAAIAPEHREQRTSTSANQLPFPANISSRPFTREKNTPTRQRLNTSRSMSLLRDLRGSIAPVFKSEDNPDTFSSTTRHNKHQNGGSVTLRSKPSRFFRPKISGQDRVFRKSMRDTDNNQASTDGMRSNNGSLRLKARKVSQGFKFRLKSLFGINKDANDDAVLPEQHIEAQRSYPFQGDDQLHETDEEPPQISPTDNEPPVSQVASGVPSLHTVTQYPHLYSHEGSIESLESEQKAFDERSRITSWSNSDTSAVNTLNSCRREQGMKRLSIINENGPHVCSSSARFLPLPKQPNASTASLDQPVMQTSRVPVDGQRIYSALMKREEQLQQAQTTDSEGKCSRENFVQPGPIPQRKSSLRRSHSNDNTAATIRYVMPDSGSDSESMAGEGSEPFLSTANETRHKRMKNAGNIPSSNTDNELPALPRSGGKRPALVPRLSSRSSAFFGSPSRHLFRAESPYRRALQDQIKTNSNEHVLGSPDLNPWKGSVPSIPDLPKLRSYGSDADVRLGYTESIYSSNAEDDISKTRKILSANENWQQPKSTHGDVTIFVNTPDYDKQSSSIPPGSRVLSPLNSASDEWQTFISSKMTKLEESTIRVDAVDFRCSLPSTRPKHVRESAQIHDDDDKISVPEELPQVRAGEAKHIGASGFSDLDSSDEVEDENEDEGVDEDLPVTFDAGDSRPILRHQVPSASSLSASTHARSTVSPGTPTRAMTHKPSMRLFGVDRGKALPKVPSRTFRESISNANISTKLAKRQPNPKTSMSNLTNWTPSSDPSGKANKLSNPQQKVAGIALAKRENVVPATIDTGDSYGSEDAGVLGHNQHGGIGSKEMVDVFLSSRRQRMASNDDGDVFL